MIPARSSRNAIATLACTTLLLPGCEGRGCRETVSDARDAAVADAAAPTSSGVLEARLTSRGRPVAGRTVVFHVRADGRSELAGYADTDSDGVARLDLKDDPVELVQDATAHSYRAAFQGDAEYCSSRDSANLDLIGLP